MLFEKLNSLKCYDGSSYDKYPIGIKNLGFSIAKPKPEGHIKKTIVQELVREPEYNVTIYKEEKNLVYLQEKYTDSFYLLPINTIGEIILLKLYFNYEVVVNHEHRHCSSDSNFNIKNKELDKYFFKYKKITYFTSFKRNRSTNIFTKMQIFYNRKLYREFKNFIKVIEKYYLLSTLDIKDILFLGDNLYKYEGVHTLIPKEMPYRIKFYSIPEDHDSFCCETCKGELEVDIDNWLINGENDCHISYKCTKCNQSFLAENLVYFQKKVKFFNLFIQFVSKTDNFKSIGGEYYDSNK